MSAIRLNAANVGAARYLTESRNFAGTVHFVFQPTEEMGGEDGGAARTMRNGLFERFPSELRAAGMFVLSSCGTMAGPCRR